MKKLFFLFIVSATGLFAQGGRGGGQVGTPGLALPAVQPYTYLQSRIAAFKLTDLDLTAIAKLEEQVQPQAEAAAAARAALQVATFALPIDRTVIAEKVEALSKADQDLAVARTVAWGKLQAEMKFSPEKVTVIQKAMASPVVGGGPAGILPGVGAL